ncbi:MAG: carbohydrate kinase family protein [Candidatus Helarchaeota archaeon]
MSKNSKCLILGSLAFDFLMFYPDFFENNIVIGEKQNICGSFVVDRFKIQRGGTGGNISYYLGKLNTENILISAAGRDFKEYGELLKNSGTDLRIDIYENEQTASCYILSDKDHDQIIIFCAGALQNTSKINIAEKISAQEKIKIAINAPNPIISMINFSKQLYELKIPMIFDPGQQINEFSKDILLDILKKSNYLILNESELEILKNKLKFNEKKINNFVDVIIVTLGAKGSKILKNEEEINIPAVKTLKIVDTTGAGDAYRAGLLAGIYNNLSIEESCKMGSVIGSFAVESPQPQNEDFSFNDLKLRYEENFGKFPIS